MRLARDLQPLVGMERLKVRSLGTFEVSRGGHALPAGPARPIELLMNLISLGGAAVPHALLGDLMWPEADGDAVRRAFDTTLHRLRSWLGERDAILLSRGRASVNFELCDVDCHELERLLKEPVEPEPGRYFMRVYELYRGPFLDQSTLAAALPYREKLHSRVLNRQLGAARAVEERQRFDEAVDLFRMALEIDDAYEPFYHGLMRNFGSLGYPSEVARTLQRCGNVLASRYRIAYSRHTLALAQRLGVDACVGAGA